MPRARPPPIHPAYRRVIVEHRARLDRLADHYAPAQLKKLYEAGQHELEAKLRAHVHAGKGERFSAHQMRMSLGMLRDGQARLAAKMANALGSVTEDVQRDAVRGIAGSIAKLHRTFTGSEVVLPVEEAARFAGIIDKGRSSMLRMHRTSFARYGARLVGTLEKELATSLLTGESPAESIGRVMDKARGEWWQAERICRTEAAFAFSAGHAAGIAAAAEEIPDLMMRWSEHCDEDGDPLDDRVAVDSLAMTSQVVEPGGLFTMPPESEVPDAKGRTDVPEALVGRRWPHPPNRPNDRATLEPWSPRWGIPGWRWSRGERVPVTDDRSAAEKRRESEIDVDAAVSVSED